jgi:chromosome partitioning protein
MKTLTIASTKGGMGKSTITWNLGSAIHESGSSIAFIDIDIHSTLTHTNDARVASGLEPLTVLRPKTIQELVDFIQNTEVDYILIDVGGYDYDLGRVATAIADQIIIPLAEDPTEIYGFETFTKFLGQIEEQSPLPPIMFVINHAHYRASTFPKVREVAALRPTATIADTIIRRRAVYSASMGTGIGVAEQPARYATAADEITRLAREVM